MLYIAESFPQSYESLSHCLKWTFGGSGVEDKGPHLDVAISFGDKPDSPSPPLP
jgi:hypothetical protein